MTATPPQEIFDDVKRCSLAIWRTYDDTYWYATEKVSRVEPIENMRDNMEYIIGMFDWENQNKLLALLSEDSRWYVEAMLSYNNSEMWFMNG